MRSLLLGLSVPACLLFAQTLQPQEIQFSAVPYLPRTGFAIHTESRLVDVGVVVRDDRGHPVPGLTRGDFEVFDNGKRHDIAAFSVQTFVPAPDTQPAAAKPSSAPAAPTAPPAAPVKPRFVALVFDDISMAPGDMVHSKIAAKSFLKSGLAANDRVSIFTTAQGQLLPFTADKATLAEAIDHITFQELRHEMNGCPLLKEYDAYLIANHLDQNELDVKAQEYANCNPICGSNTPRRGSSSTACARAYQDVQSFSNGLWEEIRSQSLNTVRALQTIVEFLARENGSRMMLLASSGFLSGTLETDQDLVIDHALHANVVINSLDAKGLYTEDAPVMGMGATPRSITQQQLLGTRPKEETNSAMGNLADATGGLFFHNSNDLDLGFHDLGMQPAVSYMLGFVPDSPDGRYHHLKVTLANRRRGHLQARLGYMAASAAAAGKPAPERPIDREVFSGRQLDDVAVRVDAQPARLENGKPVVHLALRCDVAKMRFQTASGAHTEKVRVIAALLDANNNFVTGKEATVEFALTDATFQRVLSNGLSLSLSLEAPPAAYRLRTVISEDDDQHLSARTQPLELK